MEKNKYIIYLICYFIKFLILFISTTKYLHNDTDIISCNKNKNVTIEKIKYFLLGKWILLYQNSGTLYVKFDSVFKYIYINKKLIDKNKYSILIEKDTIEILNNIDTCLIHYLITDDGLKQKIEVLSENALHLESIVNLKTEVYRRLKIPKKKYLKNK
jgi:hypothetical protein